MLKLNYSRDDAKIKLEIGIKLSAVGAKFKLEMRLKLN